MKMLTNYSFEMDKWKPPNRQTQQVLVLERIVAFFSIERRILMRVLWLQRGSSLSLFFLERNVPSWESSRAKLWIILYRVMNGYFSTNSNFGV